MWKVLVCPAGEEFVRIGTIDERGQETSTVITRDTARAIAEDLLRIAFGDVVLGLTKGGKS